MVIPKKIGVIGVGHMSGTMIEGWARLGDDMPRFYLSPRGAEAAAALAERYGCEVLKSNAEVVEASEAVILAVRPWQAEEALKGLPWRRDQLALSVMASVKTEVLKPLVAPATVARCIPVTACVYGESATTLYPDEPRAKALLAALGPPTVLEDESAFDRLSVHGCTYGWALALIDEVRRWTEESGIPPETARQHVAQVFRAAATMARESSAPVAHLVDELASPRSFTRMGLEVLRRENAFAPWQNALDTIRKQYDG
ncbi:NAD(P)-binding domain-containing protein [Limibacillus sp. MBR-115]|jgi:pyrroline-5-carboxylate reductase|uniref:NAD(P)-binding domain-containing protein n=1 Tax=Limibacillus sp. MBR-115 TaxID=3156465 RepID=UPI003392EBE4